MPTYWCPNCQSHFVLLEVYYKPPRTVTCPHCKHTVSNSESPVE